MGELHFDDLSVAEAASEAAPFAAAGSQLAGFLRRLPEACRRAGLDPDRTSLLVHIVPERPEGHAFAGPMFMSSGEDSVRACGLLLGRVTEAMSLLSAAQQNGGVGHRFDGGFGRRRGRADRRRRPGRGDGADRQEDRVRRAAAPAGPQGETARADTVGDDRGGGFSWCSRCHHDLTSGPRPDACPGCGRALEPGSVGPYPFGGSDF